MVNPKAVPDTIVELDESAGLTPEDVLRMLETTCAGLSSDEVSRRLRLYGPNAIADRAVWPWDVLVRQLRNPLLLLLAVTALLSVFLGEKTDALIILSIVLLSVGLGFVNEYRSERAITDLHACVRRSAEVLRDGSQMDVDVTALVPGDIVLLSVGDIVPADIRLIEAHMLECDESTLTGESIPVTKSAERCIPPELTSCVFMGTIIRAGSASGVVVRTGAATAFGRVATRLVERAPETAFQRGLRAFSKLLVWVTAVITTTVFLVNTVVRHSLLESLLFSLAIAVSLTPQLLPAIVTISLAAGARSMARRSVLVKRLVSIENLGNMEVLFTDKTGTLTEGKIVFSAALDVAGNPSDEVLRLGRLCTSTASEAQRGIGVLDAALDEAANARGFLLGGIRRITELPFDYERRLISVLLDDGAKRLIITKGAPESVLARCRNVPPELEALLTERFAAGFRVVALAQREADGMETIGKEDERDLTPLGLLLFIDPPKADAANSIARLERLGITVKIITGDNELVARNVCDRLAIPVSGTLTGSALATMTDCEVVQALPTTTIFARVSPEQKARLIDLQRSAEVDVGFLGDGVNDAIALHRADVGISVESACDVAKDAADIVMITKDLGILADGVVEGRRVFTNTIKYVLMATSSNFGNMLSAAVGSLFLPFLPMLPSQILLNNLLYDVSEMTIPTDNVDEEQLKRPVHWDMGLIKSFMVLFGPINALCDFTIFAVMLFGFHASAELFRSGYFAESFITQTLIVFAIRTRRVPFIRSLPSRQLAMTTIGVTLVGALLPFSPLGSFFGFAPLPFQFIALIVLLVLVYIALVETAKVHFYSHLHATQTR
jgi:Mg2+-importing ATPase